MIHGKARITLLSERMLRLEWADDAVFEDRASLPVTNRRLPAVKFTAKVHANELVVTTRFLELRYRDTGRPFARSNLSVEFVHSAGQRRRWRHGARDRHNLGGTFRTLDNTRGDRHIAGDHQGKQIDLGEGFVSRSGWV